jgi:preprotein translocase subunit SecB
LEGNPAFRILKTNEGSDVISVDYAIGKDPDSLSFLIKLSLVINKKKTDFEKGRYKIELELLSIFDFPKNTSKEEVQKLLEPNGLAMSYSTARGIVGDVTASAMNGRYILPSINFVKVIEAKHKKKNNKTE